MIKIGSYNKLNVSRFSEHGVYLTDSDRTSEVLLPRQYTTPDMRIGDEINTFVYTDSEDRPVATTMSPYATVGEFAFLKVTAVNQMGAFLDWGLPKELLVPYSQQKDKMRPGNTYLVYIYLDNASGRVVASAKIHQFLGNVYPDMKNGTSVSLLAYKRTPIGIGCIVDNLHKGMLYYDELYREIEPGDKLRGYVKTVRDDGKIDITLKPKAAERTSTLAERIITFMKLNGNVLDLNDKSSPDVIQFRFQCSKRDFKKAIGNLLKTGSICRKNDTFTIS